MEVVEDSIKLYVSCFFTVIAIRSVLTKCYRFVAIGISHGIPIRDSEMPGWWGNPWYGYHGDDGILFKHPYGTRSTYETYKKGDVVGAGIDPETGRFFVTKNGKYQGELTDLHLKLP